MRRAAAHIVGLWGTYWAVPLVPAGYAAILLAFGNLRPEHILGAVALAAFGYASRLTRDLFVAFIPLILILLASDVMRYPLAVLVTPERVAGCGLRAVELALFGVAPDTTLADVFARHHAPVFDLIFAVPYALFVHIAALYAGYLFFVDRARMQHFLWSLAFGYLILFAVWAIFPAAPPWYIRAHGCVIDTGVAASPAGLLRIDQWLGISYFEAFYSRATTVFGAMPSMHCATPMIGLLTAWRAATPLTRSVHVGYTLTMLAASIYLDHHWLLDGLAGWLLAGVAVLATGALLQRRNWRKAAAPTPAASA
jgi:hypothetical protein